MNKLLIDMAELEESIEDVQFELALEDDPEIRERLFEELDVLQYDLSLLQEKFDIAH